MSHGSPTRPSRSRGGGWEMSDITPALLARPGSGLASRGVLLLLLLLLLASNPVWGSNATMTTAPTTNSTTAGDESSEGLNIAAIVAPTVVLGLLAVALVVLVWLLCVVKKKRQTEGTYQPSAEEQSGARSVEMPDALKLPKEERLI